MNVLRKWQIIKREKCCYWAHHVPGKCNIFSSKWAWLFSAAFCIVCDFACSFLLWNMESGTLWLDRQRNVKRCFSCSRRFQFWETLTMFQNICKTIYVPQASLPPRWSPSSLTYLFHNATALDLMHCSVVELWKIMIRKSSKRLHVLLWVHVCISL